MSFCIRFSDELERATNQHVELAMKIWKTAKPNPALSIRVAAGNYAGYGTYVARCHPSGIIEFPVGNSFSVLRLAKNEVTFKGPKQAYLGTLLHEIGHHVVTTSRATPWAPYIDGGASTHLRKAWIWICHTGWTHFHKDVPSIPAIVDTLKSADRKKMVDALTHFSPYQKPPQIKPIMRVCEYCGGSMEHKRRKARFCCPSCRAMDSRQRKG